MISCVTRLNHIWRVWLHTFSAFLPTRNMYSTSSLGPFRFCSETCSAKNTASKRPKQHPLRPEHVLNQLPCPRHLRAPLFLPFLERMRHLLAKHLNLQPVMPLRQLPLSLLRHAQALLPFRVAGRPLYPSHPYIALSSLSSSIFPPLLSVSPRKKPPCFQVVLPRLLL
jgi:hypothetical protein